MTEEIRALVSSYLLCIYVNLSGLEENLTKVAQMPGVHK